MHLAVLAIINNFHSPWNSAILYMMCAIQLSKCVIHGNLHVQMMCIMEPLQMALNSHWVLTGSNSPKSFWHFKLRWDETISQFRVSIWGPEGILFQTITSHHGWNGSPHRVPCHCQSPCVLEYWDIPVPNVLRFKPPLSTTALPSDTWVILPTDIVEYSLQ